MRKKKVSCQIIYHSLHVFCQRAFTLLEMLVVIGIIAVLVGLGSVSYSTAQKKSRDAKRKADLKAIQNSLEQYYSICGYVYPTSVVNNIVCPTGSVTILTPVPADPKSGSSYIYTYDSANNKYSLCIPTPPFETEVLSTYCLQNQQ